MHAMLTTTVANYAVSEDQIDEARNAAMALGSNALLQLWNDRLELFQSMGTIGLTPSIWTHTPVPMGFDLIALKQQFEERAASVLGDYDSSVNFDVFGQYDDTRTGTYSDHRYVDPTVRAAWMMYVDQAIEHFNSK